MKQRRTPTKRRRILRWTLVAAGVLILAVAVPTSRAAIWGLLRGEHFHDGLPQSYWVQKLNETQDPWAAKALADIGQADPATVAALTDALKVGCDKTRGNIRLARVAARSLGQLGPPARTALPVLCQALTNENPPIRSAAAEAVARIGPAEAVEHLQKRLKDPDAAVRSQAAQALGAIAPHAHAAIPALAAVLTDSTDDVRVRAMEALGAMGPAAAPAVPALLEALNKNQWGSWFVIRALGRIGPAAQPAVPALVKRLGGFFEGKDAGRALAAIGPAAVPALVDVLCSPERADDARNKDDRRRAAQALQRIGPAGVAALVERLHQRDPRTRAQAAEALVLVADVAESAVPDLLKALHDDSAEVRAAAVLPLGVCTRQAASVVPALVEALRDPDERVRSRAAQALENLGPRARAAVPEMLRLLHGDSQNLRYQAAKALAVLGEHTKEAVPELIAALAVKDQVVRSEAAEYLGRIGPAAAPAVPVLLACRGDYWRQNEINKADEAIRKIGYRQALPQLIEALRNKDEQVRKGAAEVLADVGPEAQSAAAELEAMARGDGNHALRVLAARALWQVKPPSPVALEVLQGLLQDSDTGVRTFAGETLKKLDPAAASKAGVK